MQFPSLRILRRAATSLRLTTGVLLTACAYAAVLAYYVGGGSTTLKAAKDRTIV